MKSYVCLFCVLTALNVSIAKAESVTLPGASGIRDNSLCADVDMSNGSLGVPGIVPCSAMYPLNVPAGKTVDSVQVAYTNIIDPSASITASLMEYRPTQPASVTTLATASDMPIAGFGPFFLTLSAVRPLASKTSYWVTVSINHIERINSVTVTYH